MRGLHAVIAGMLLAGTVAATANAETSPLVGGPPPGDTPPVIAGCDAACANPPCPPRQRHVRRHYRRARVAPHLVAAVGPDWWALYNPPLPDPRDTAYDRGMTLHFRNGAVSGIVVEDPGFLAPLPPITGNHLYRVQAGGGILQYDGITGQYIPLSTHDVARIAAAAAHAPAPVAR